MESETSTLQQPPQQLQQQQKQQQQQQPQQQERRPESVLASEAEKRVSTSHGRPETRESTSTSNQSQNNHHRPSSKRADDLILGSRPTSKDVTSMKTPHTTPRDPTTANGSDSVGEVLRSMVAGNAVPEENDVFGDILDEDELFMTMSPEERLEWDKMMEERERHLDDSREKHQNWSDSFTRRRMFAYTRMHKLNLSYQDRMKLFSNMAETINHVASRRASEEAASFKKRPVKKRLSEPLLESKNEPAATKTDKKTLKHSNTSSDILSKPGIPANTKTQENNNQSLGVDANGRKSSKDVVCKMEQVI